MNEKQSLNIKTFNFKDKKQYQRPNSEIQRVLSANNFCKDIRI